MSDPSQLTGKHALGHINYCLSIVTPMFLTTCRQPEAGVPCFLEWIES